MKLEQKLQSAYDELDIDTDNRQRIGSMLDLMRYVHEDTYTHSIRVGLLAREIGEFMHLDGKPLLYGGLLHDSGKILLDKNLLTKKDFNDEDMKKMRKHVEYSYNILKDIFPFSAELAVRHHKFQKDPYPENISESKSIQSNNTTSSVNMYSRILSLADFYDALTSRHNEKFSGEESEILLKNNPDIQQLIKSLYDAGIFKGTYKKSKNIINKNTNINKIDAAKQKIIDEAKEQQIYENIPWTIERTPEDISRCVMLAAALEPLSNKFGCTTRYNDINPHIKLEYFITSAINMGESFKKLADRILTSDRQPEIIYDLAYEAQLETKRQRSGGRINQGIIEILFPIVAAQALYDKNNSLSIDNLLIQAVNVLKSTSRADIDELVKMKRLAYDLCCYFNRPIPAHSDTTNIYEYYYKEWEESVTSSGKAHNYEFINGFSNVKDIYDAIISSEEHSLSRKVVDAYQLSRLNKHKDAPVGITADHVAAALYLLLSKNHDMIIT